MAHPKRKPSRFISSILWYCFFLVFSPLLWCQITQSIVLPATGSANNGSVTACTTDCQYEVFLQNWGTITNTFNAVSVGGMTVQFCPNCASGATNAITVFWPQGSAGPCAGGNPYYLGLPGLVSQNLYIKFRFSVSGNTNLANGLAKTSTVEYWDATGTLVHSSTCTYTALTGTPGAGATVGDVASATAVTVAFVRGSTHLDADNTQMPVTTPAGTYATGIFWEWKFDNSLVDSSGNGFTATLTNVPCAANACYTSTGTSQNLVVSRPQFNPTSWSDWTSMKTGVSNALSSASFSQAAGSSVPSAFSWTQNTATTGCTGGETVSISGNTTATPSVTPTVLGPLCFDLLVTDANSNTATATLIMGAVPQNTSGVVQNTDAHVAEFFGPLIAFGKNPWGFEDKQNKVAVDEQTTYWASVFDSTWTTTNTSGTIGYPFYAKGFSPGSACTTLSGNGGSISNSTLTVKIADATCLSLAGLPTEPTWILVGTSQFSTSTWEMMRVCSTTATSGPATLTICYDGRGVSGNNWANSVGGVTNVGAANTWNDGALVGEMRVQGTSTLFATDATRPICPAGVPGPPGPVLYSTGTVTLSASSTTVTGSGTTWTSAMVGGFIRVAATHASGTSFIFWAQISGFTDTTHLVMNRPAPTGVDATAFPYKITSPLYLDMEFSAPDLSGGTFHTARTYFNGVGCESETAMFALPFHDNAALDTVAQSGVHYSYTFNPNDIYIPNSNFAPYYGVGLMARNFYYRSGYGPALTLANAVDEYAVRDPGFSDGYMGGQPLETGGFVIGAMADLLLNGSTVLHWYNVEQYAFSGEFQSSACNITDTRDGGYLEAFLAIASNYDTNSTNKTSFQNALGLSSPSMLSRDTTCRRNAADGYSGAEVNSFSNSFVFNPASSVGSNPLVLTNGSAAVTGTGFTNTMAGTYPNYSGSTSGGQCWGQDIITLTVTHGSSLATVSSGTLNPASLIYFYDGSNVGVYQFTVSGVSVQLAGIWNGSSGTFSAMSTGGGPINTGGQVVGGYGGIVAQTSPTTPPADTFANNQALQHVWACKFNSSTSLTLFRTWDGTSSSGLGGGLNYYISYYNIGTFGQQPFMYGIKTNAMRWASKNSNSTIANTAAAFLPLMGEWFNSYGWDSNNATGLGTFYDVAFDACGSNADVPSGSTLDGANTFDSIHGFQGCGSSGLTTTGITTARVNSVEAGAAMLQYFTNECSLGTTQCNAARTQVDKFYGAIFGYQPDCDSSIASTCGSLIASNYTDTDLSHYKWPGFFFGIGGFFSNVWPAVRTQDVVVISGNVSSGPVVIRGNVTKP